MCKVKPEGDFEKEPHDGLSRALGAHVGHDRRRDGRDGQWHDVEKHDAAECARRILLRSVRYLISNRMPVIR